MKVKSIDLSWFRGSGDRAILNTDLKNVVIYGANGSGKSSFSDAIEYVVTKGKIRHLMHEYSGSRQEKGIINTHAPAGKGAAICITFEGDVSIDAQLTSYGAPSFSSNPEDLVGFVQTWELERLILRQDEVAAFIEKTKGGKYSVLLPLLGLENLEQAAENLGKLRQSVEEEGELLKKRTRLDILKQEVAKHFPDVSEETVLNVLKNIAKSYIEEKIPEELRVLADILTESVKQRIDSLAPEITRHALVTKIHEEDLSAKLEAMIKADEKIIGKVDTLLDSHIEILQEASKYVDKLDSSKKEIECPACGRTIGIDEFGEHVRNELQSLKDICLARDSAIEVRQALKNSIRQVLVYAKDDSVSSWLENKKQKELNEALTELAGIDEQEWHDTYSSEDKVKLCRIVPVIVNRVKAAADLVPPSNQKLLNDSLVVEASKNIPLVNSLASQVTAIGDIVRSLDTSEAQIRNSIRSRTERIIQEVSADIQALWSRIHPREPIEDVKLYLPEDTDKSIEIGLKFHGQEQPSPRLTLSEGHRNSLGLCIFLALARLGGNRQSPIFLDDIVSSLDRWHRGNVTDLLLEDLTDRQVLLFTHDREWFQELRVLLPSDSWKFLVLKPWNSPSIGLQWSVSEDTFDDARSLIDQNCESAGNCVRQIMDTHLAVTTEKLKIKMPYARGDRNDHRTCIEFLENIMSEARERLRREEAGAWKKYPEPITDWKKAHDLLVSWANRASHTGSLVPDEVENLLQACEVALSRFKCPECGTYIWRADQTSQEIMQCRCGKMQWRYG
jgi:recombinational DNA repair ATPase RecF/predicted RNA-binding Zn-ribbon protein involved in translation (DUF1610 family)